MAIPAVYLRSAYLDHLTKGRVAWNSVTSYLESAGRNYGQTGLPEHDERYVIADAYCDVCYKLWETSWEDDAVVKDRARGIYADPAKVHDVRHDGQYYHVHGCHLSKPSPQRTPVLFQAGASPRGREFAARHAECVFVLGSKPEVDGHYIRDIRRIARQQDRNPEISGIGRAFFTQVGLPVSRAEIPKSSCVLHIHTKVITGRYRSRGEVQVRGIF